MLSIAALTKYVLAALVAWLPSAPKPLLGDVASAVAEASNGDVRLATELAALGLEESHYAEWVIDGRCNSGTWRSSPEAAPMLKIGTCDWSHAFGAWQMHHYEGGAPVEDLLDLHAGARAAAALWKVNPALWTPHKRAIARAQAWRAAQPVAKAGTSE